MPALDEATSRYWNAVFGGITALGLVLGGGYTLLQYLDAKANDQEVHKKDVATLKLQVDATKLAAQQAFNNKHMELCSRASEDAGTIATSTNPSKRADATDDFWRLYWGPLGIVEDKAVEGAMVAFGDCLTALSNGQKCEKDLTSLSLDLARACRTEVKSNFDVDLPNLPAREK